MAFSFWCRKGHLEQLRQRQANIERRLGRGLVFHIAPSNVPSDPGRITNIPPTIAAKDA